MDPKGERPIIRHTTVAHDRRKVNAILNAFREAMFAEADRRLKTGEMKTGWEALTPGNLLMYRKALVASMKRGMLDRADAEERIGLEAALTWFLRLEKEKQDRITGQW